MKPDDTSSAVSIRLFGPFEVCVRGQPLPRLRFRKSPAVLALLVLRHSSLAVGEGRWGGVERDWLAGLLWPEALPAAALHSLRNCLTDLRQALGAEAGRLRAPTARTLALDLTGAFVDVLAFDAALARDDPEALEEAVALYRGPLLEASTEEWAFQERQRREQAYLKALETLAALARAGSDPAAAERHLRLAVAADPLRESTQRTLMELLAAGGNYAAALLAYRELRLRLHRELNTEPDPETQALFQRLRAEAREKASVSRPARLTRRSLGALAPPAPRHEASGDSARACRDAQWEDGPRHAAGGAGLQTPAFPPFHRQYDPCVAAAGREAAQEAAAPRHSFPLPLTRFIGRAAEIAQLCALLTPRDEERGQGEDQHVRPAPSLVPSSSRLITLTGAGGCGKTRLALEAAAGLLPAYAAGVRLVELASLPDPALVLPTLAAALGVRPEPDRPLTQTLVQALRPQQLLLVLDNCEHLVDACAALAETLLQNCPLLRVLATSREPLGIGGELPYRVPPLPVPGLQAFRPDGKEEKNPRGGDPVARRLPSHRIGRGAGSEGRTAPK